MTALHNVSAHLQETTADVCGLEKTVNQFVDLKNSRQTQPATIKLSMLNRINHLVVRGTLMKSVYQIGL